MKPVRSTIMAGALLGMLSGAVPAAAEDDDAARAARWHDLQHAVFGDRVVKDGGGIIALDAPVRALDAALVPVTVTISGPAKIKTIYLTVDDNPSPLAGTFHFGPAGDPHILKTRLRVNAYTLLHAVAETEDGQLYTTAKFIKASGGCSAPASGDPTEALARLGQMKLKPAEVSTTRGVTELQLLISHPNFNGMQMDPVTRDYTPARFMQTVTVTSGGKLVFELESDISMSEDPAITFGLRPQGMAPLDVEMRDSSNARFQQHFDLPAKGV